jgi:hypothetical protein
LARTLLFAIPAILLLLLLSSIAPSVTVQVTTTAITATTFTDDTGFTVELALGWTANDYDNKGGEALAAENKLGYAKLVTFCSDNNEVPTCDESLGDYVQVFRYKDLHKRPEFASIIASGKPITANDMFLYHLEELKERQSSNPYYLPHIYEEWTQENVEVGRIITSPSGQELATPVYGKITGIDALYNLYFVDDSTDIGYRVSSDSFSVGELAIGSIDSLPLEMITIFDSASLLPAPAAVSHPVIPYILLLLSLRPHNNEGVSESGNPMVSFFLPV